MKRSQRTGKRGRDACATGATSATGITGAQSLQRAPGISGVIGAGDATKATAATDKESRNTTMVPVDANRCSVELQPSKSWCTRVQMQSVLQQVWSTGSTIMPAPVQRLMIDYTETIVSRVLVRGADGKTDTVVDWAMDSVFDERWSSSSRPGHSVRQPMASDIIHKIMSCRIKASPQSNAWVEPVLSYNKARAEIFGTRKVSDQGIFPLEFTNTIDCSFPTAREIILIQERQPASPGTGYLIQWTSMDRCTGDRLGSYCATFGHSNSPLNTMRFLDDKRVGFLSDMTELTILQWPSLSVAQRINLTRATTLRGQVAYANSVMSVG